MLVRCLESILLESDATVANTASAIAAREAVGNSGTVDVVLVLEVVVVDDADAWVTVREAVPELPALEGSPP